MTQAVVAGAIVVATLNALSGLTGAWIWYRGDPREGRAAPAFWVMLRIGQGSALTLAIAVGSLAAAGKHPREDLFYLYALLPLAIGFVAEQLRVTSAQAVLEERGMQSAQEVGTLPDGEQQELLASVLRRELGVMALSALVVVFLALRAAGTAHGF
ncbi:MAG: hypothetical protein H0X28_05495 [Solirubrobacterales bacterium]|nr:hypothetical protein [Solirubrobacterales bacterium]